jgi:hypothetical protein
LCNGGCHRQQANRLLPITRWASNHKGSEPVSDEKYPELFGDLVYAYTRADALRDGVLVMLAHAEAMGFRVPVAITSAAYADCIAWPHPDPKLPDILRLREEVVLLSALAEAKAQRRRLSQGSEERTDRIDFVVDAVTLEGSRAEVVKVPVYMVIGPGDNGEMVGTIMLVGED